MAKRQTFKKQGKSPAANQRNGQIKLLQSIDTNSANMYNNRSDTQIWNVDSGYPPRFGHNNKFDGKIHNITQFSGHQAAFATNSTTPSFYSTQFNLNYLNQVASFQAIFDQYRIMEIEVWIHPEGSPSGTALTGVYQGSLYTVIDYDDSNALTSTAQATQYENCTVTPLQTCGVYRKFRPHQAAATYQGTFAGFQNEVSTWNDVAYPAIQHYGLKLAADPTPTAGAVQYVIDTRVWVQFRNIQ
jgi:hypothetical protein